MYQHTHKADNCEVQDLWLITDEVFEIEMIWKELTDLDSVTVAVQGDDAIPCAAQELFDEVAERHPNTNCRPANNAPIVENHYFESTICRVQSGQEFSLSSIKESQSPVFF